MAQDDLNTPLGVSRAPDAAAAGTGRGLSVRTVAVFGVLAACGGTAAWLALGDEGTGGRARAVARITADKPPEKVAAIPAAAAPKADNTPTGSVKVIDAARMDGGAIENRSGVKVVRREGGTPGALIISIPDAAPSVGLTPAPDSRLVRKSRFGLLPVIGRDGSKALEVYARPMVTQGKLPRSAPRLAIVVGGMGLSETVTAQAVANLPASVSLAFAPYGKNLQAQVTRARDAGHEIILQVPMEPFDLAGPGPGPQLLKVQYDRKQMKERLHWHMGRFTGYIGIANFLGAKFTADAQALAPVIEEIRSRGLMYFDDGSSPRSLAARLSSASATPFAQADIIIDERRDAKSVDAAMQRLEARAVQKGLAIGFANALPEVVARIARFAQGLERRGVALVPLSALTEARGAQARKD